MHSSNSNVEDNESNSEHRFDLNGFSSHSNYRYDLVLFPRVLDLCLSFMVEKKKTFATLRHTLATAGATTPLGNPEKADEEECHFDMIVERFLKKLLHLLETCNFNVQIFISNVNATEFYGSTLFM